MRLIQIYGNIRLNDAGKFRLFKDTLPLWMAYWDCPAFIRVRGKFGVEAQRYSTGLTGLEVAAGSHFRSWRRQSLADLETLSAQFTFQFLEDHMPYPNSVPASEILRQMESNRIDVLGYSWFESYKGARDFLRRKGEAQTGPVLSFQLDRKEARDYYATTGRYIVGLTSVFETGWLKNLLMSPHPVLRRFEADTPFDLEQPIGTRWFCPIVFGLPELPIGICIDDDHRAPGSSAKSKGLYSGEVSDYVPDHFSRPFASRLKESSRRMSRFSGLRWLHEVLLTVVLSLDALRREALDVLEFRRHKPNSFA